jgi:hypothetical protein
MAVEIIANSECGITSGSSRPLKSAAAEPQGVRLPKNPLTGIEFKVILVLSKET